MVIVAVKLEEGIVEGPDPRAHSPLPPPPPPPPPRPSRSRLHNFTFLCSWGTQRTLRCSKFPLSGQHDAAGSMAPAADQNGWAARRRPLTPLEKSFLPKKFSKGVKDLKEGEGRGREVERSSSTAADGPARNLRTRRAACNAPAENEQYRYHAWASRCPLPLAEEKSCTATEMVNKRADGSDERKHQTFSISLSCEEIVQDFLAIKGTKPPRRPKKRPRAVRRQVDFVSPGLWLSEITPERYKIDE